jgi:alpha-1,3-rhamnosyl/mannosyltransferase
VLFVGVIQRRKNVLRLMEAFSKLGTDACLALAGPVQQSFRSDFEAARQPLGDRVRTLGYVPNSDLPSLYAGARCFVVPSEYESFGIPLLEAMSCGCPVAASRVGGMPEVCGQAAEMLDPLSTESILAALERVLEPARASALRSAGLERARGFSYARVARETLAVYRSLL